MYKGITFSASIMCVDWLNLSQQLKDLEKNEIDLFHIDVIDGYFAPDFTMGSSIINLVRNNSSIKSDFHIMADEPSRLFNSFDVSKMVIIKEALHRMLYIKKNMSKVMLHHGTSTETLGKEIDMVILMTVNPGYMGQQLVPRFKEVKKLISKKYGLTQNFS